MTDRYHTLFEMTTYSFNPREDKLDRDGIEELDDIYTDYKKMYEICMEWYYKNQFWLKTKLSIKSLLSLNRDELSAADEDAILTSFKNWNIDYWYYNNTIKKDKIYEQALEEYNKTYNFYRHMEKISKNARHNIDVLKYRRNQFN